MIVKILGLFLTYCVILALVGCGIAGRGNGGPQEGVSSSSPIVLETEAVVILEEPATATDIPPTLTPSPLPTEKPTTAPTATVPATPTIPVQLTATETPPATETAVPLLVPEWLAYLNRFRTMANLPPLVDLEGSTTGSRLHSRYMVGNDAPIAHFEEKEKPFYDENGDQAARSANLFATGQMEANYLWGINFWISAPFHLLGILNPNLEVVGFGEYKEEVGGTQMAAVLNLLPSPAGSVPVIEYPIMFPGDGTETWVVRHSLFEWPYPFDGCPGFEPPTGPPIVILLGDGSKVPNVSNHRFAQGDQVLESCLFDETSYRNNDPYAEQVGREILNTRDAVMIMPREPLIVGQTYTAQVTADGETYTWQFSVRKGPD